jgi:PAS domain S-box-containing protein
MAGYQAPDAVLTLLYVEDEVVTRETVCTLLGRQFPGLVIHTAANGAEGVQLFQDLAPDLVVTDIKMPVMNGIEMSRRIMKLSATVPIIVTSAHSDLAFLIESIEIGISRYVMKPIESAKLFGAVEGCLAALRLEKKLQAQQEFIRKLSRAVEQSPSSIAITDPQGVIEYVNPKFSWLTGYSESELLGRNLRALQQGGEELWGALALGLEWHGELEGAKKSGEPYSDSTSVSPVLNEQGVITHLVAVKEDITERKRNAREIELLNRSLEARASELEIANRDLEAFSYTVSHDLRTPLTNINGYCQVILELYGAVLDEQCKDFVNVILSETVNMNELIRTLLDFSRLSRTEMTRGRADLSEMAVMIAAALQMCDPQRKVTFRIAPGIAAEGDRELLRVVLNNLLGNAFKYSAQKEEALIEFGVTESGGQSAYFVRDNGAGFDMSQAVKLFSPFQRLHSEREFNGFGIGLATVQRIVERHGGKVWAKGEVEKGATFYFTLPAPAPEMAQRI